MFYLIPLGVQGGSIKFPWAGTAILLATVLSFLATWVLRPPPAADEGKDIAAAVAYWGQHPYLDYPNYFSRRFLARDVQDDVADTRRIWALSHQVPSEAEVVAQQRELGTLSRLACERAQTPALRAFSLDRTRGFAQPGWLTYLFLHAGWWHLIGNMVFLYAVALVLENAWGSVLFALFYLLGGVVSGATEVLLDPAPVTFVVGASGAVSACIGAAAVRFATQQLRMGYFLWLGFFFRSGTFLIPVWAWGAFRLVSEVVSFVTGGSAGVAVLAHLGGLVFGAIFAMAIGLVGFERRRIGTWANEDEVRRQLELGRVALQAGRHLPARRAFEAALDLSEDDLEAHQGWMETEVAQRRPSEALKRLERLVGQAQRQDRPDRLRALARHAATALPLDGLSPGVAWTLARALEAEAPSAHESMTLFLRAAEPISALTARALLSAADLALVLGLPEQARSISGRLGTLDIPPALHEQRLRLRRQLGEDT